MKKYLLSLLFLAAAWGLSAQPANLNVNLAGQLSNPGDLNDCWGWVDNQGKEYAIVGIQSGGVGIIDISNSSNPQLVLSIPGVPSLWRDMKHWGNYVYVVNDDGGAGGNGLLIIDMSGAPNNIQYKDTVISGMTVAHNIYIDDGYAYCVGADNNPGINILDLSDPWFPTQVGQYTATYVHDIYVRNDTAYSSELGVGLTIIDVTTKSNPQIIGNRTYVDNFTHNAWLSDDGNTCFTTDEIARGYLYAWDVSDPGNIGYLDRIRSSLSNGEAIPHNTHVLNDYLVTSYYRDGLNIVDAQRPHNLVEVGYYDTSPLDNSGFDGNWGAFPFFPSGKILASDMQGGTFIFDVTFVRACYLEGEVTDKVTGLIIPGADVTVQNQTWDAETDNNGFYATGTPTPGTYSVTYSAFGYMDTTISVTLTNGQLEIRDIPLTPASDYSLSLNVLEVGTNNPIANAEVLFLAPNGPTLAYTANVAGQVNDPNFISANYSVIAGKWGWVTKEVAYSGNSNNPSLTIFLEPGYYDDFALDFNWATAATASSGFWELDEPFGTTDWQGTQSHPEFDWATDISDQCYSTGNGGGGVGNDDIDAGEVILTSPSMDLSNYQDPVLSYRRWFFNEGGQGATNDTFAIEIDNGITRVRLNTITGTENFWRLDTFTISNFIAPTNNVKVIFRAGDYFDGHIVEAAVDLFEVTDRVITRNDEPQVLQTKLEIYPNPVGSTATVRFDAHPAEAGDLRFELRDMMGRKLSGRSLVGNAGSFFLDTNLPAGVYFGSIMNGEEVLQTVRIVK